MPDQTDQTWTAPQTNNRRPMATMEEDLMFGLDEKELLRRVTHLECESCGFCQPVQLADWFEFIDDVRLETRLMRCECPSPAGTPMIISDKPLIGVDELDEEHQDGPGSWRYVVDEGLLQLLRARGVTV